MTRPFIPVEHTCSVEMIYSNTPVIMENVMHVQGATAWSLSDLQTLRGVFNSWDQTYWASQRSGGVTLVRIRTKGLDTDHEPMEDYVLPVPRPGGQGGTNLPNNATFCIKLASGLAGRSQRGRLYFIGLNSNALTAPNEVGAGFATALCVYLGNLKTMLAAANPNWKLVITSFRTGGAWRTAGQNMAVDTFVAVDYHVDSQRRRLTGRGRA